MSKYPFGEYAEEYVRFMRDTCQWNDGSWPGILRRLNRQTREINALRDQNKISTSSPKSMTCEDVRVYLSQRKALNFSNGEYRKDVTYLKGLFVYCDNVAVEKCLQKYPALKPVYGDKRLPALSKEEYAKIRARALSLDPDDWNLNRAYTLVMLVLECTDRPREIRFTEVMDIDTDKWLIHVKHPKGQGTYGQVRYIWIPEYIRPLVKNYLRLRELFCGGVNHRNKKFTSTLLFPSYQSPTTVMSSNALRLVKTVVEEDIGIKFSLTKCRRTSGQRFIDIRMDSETGSVLMGNSVVTFNKYYAARRNDDAVKIQKKAVKKAVKKERKKAEKSSSGGEPSKMENSADDAGYDVMAPPHGIEPWTL